MSKPTTITAEKIYEVKEVKKKNPRLTMIQIGKLCDVSSSTASRMINGEYDHLLPQQPTASVEDAQKVRIEQLIELVELASDCKVSALDHLVEYCETLVDITAKNNELLRTIALCTVMQIDPKHNNSSRIAAEMRSNVIEATWKKNDRGAQ